MDTAISTPASARYAKCIEASKRVRWEIDRDVIRGREFDFGQKFMPDGLARIADFGLASAEERRFLSQVQGRTYANMFALVERFIGAKMLELTRGHALGDQVVVESLVRVTDEELKHQELFRRLDAMMAPGMPKGYAFLPQANDVAAAVLGKCTWAVMGLICHIELFSVDHYRQSIDHDNEVSALWKDVFLFHMKEEAQHAVLDEMEWQREDARLTGDERDQAADDLIALVGAVDGLLQIQAAADCDYFVGALPRKVPAEEVATLRSAMLAAYRWQYIVSGVRNERFMGLLTAMARPAQMERIAAALAPIVAGAAAA